MATRVKLKSRGMEALLKGNVGRAAIEGPTERAAAAAQGDAPVLTGAYRDSIRVEYDVTDRVAGRVVADVPYAHVVEALHGTLARALDAAR